MTFDPLRTIDSLVWGNQLETRGRAGRWLAIALRYLYAVLRDLFSGQLTMRAMSLVYSTLMSVVPFLAFSFSVLKGFGVYEQLEEQAYIFVEPLGEEGRNIVDTLMGIVDNVNGGVLGGVALAFFIYTALSMVQKVEESFNYVWYVSKPRSLSRRFTEYMFVMLVGPLAMVIALGAITSLQNESLVQYLLNNEIVGPFFVATSKLMPYVIVSLMFGFLYAFLPNTRVTFKAAAVGGVAGGFMWASVGVIFTAFIVNATRTQAVYASFAIAIVTLIWIYLNWMVLLLGAQLAFYAQNPGYLRNGRQDRPLSNTTRERLALDIMLRVGQKFRDPDGTISLEQLSESLGLPSLTIEPVTLALEQGGLLATNEHGDLLPGRDIALMTLDDILSVVRSGAGKEFASNARWSPAAASISKDLDLAIARTLGTRTLAAILDEIEEQDSEKKGPLRLQQS